MGGLLASEVFRLRKRTMPYLLLGLLALIVAGLYFLLYLALQVDSDVQQQDTAELEELIALSDVVGNGMDLAYSVAGVMAVILAASIIATEFSWGTIRTILPRSAGRDAFISAKLIVVAVFTVLLTIVGFIAALIASAVVSNIGDLPTSLPDNFVVETIFAVGRTTLAILPFAAFAFMLALVTRSGAAGIGVGLALFFLEETLGLLLDTAGEAGEFVADLLITANARALLNANYVDPDPDALDPWRGAAVLVVYTAIFVAIAFWRFRTRDVQVGD